MIGPEHYRAAERHARQSAETFNDEPEFSAWLQGQAQVHATLALAAATADLFALYGQVGDESKAAWKAALT